MMTWLWERWTLIKILNYTEALLPVFIGIDGTDMGLEGSGRFKYGGNGI